LYRIMVNKIYFIVGFPISSLDPTLFQLLHHQILFYCVRTFSCRIKAYVTLW